MKNLFFVGFLLLFSASYGQHVPKRTAQRVNENYYTSIESWRKIYEYEGENVSIQLYQEPIDWDAITKLSEQEYYSFILKSSEIQKSMLNFLVSELKILKQISE